MVDRGGDHQEIRGERRMKIRICDRCGEHIKEHDLDSLYIKYKIIPLRQSRRPDRDILPGIDLCKSCTSALAGWINGEIEEQAE